ncbi:MAG: hypothetical protein PVH17_12010 [Anaerolineae bacterium]|jgi:hypothetical protein
MTALKIRTFRQSVVLVAILLLGLALRLAPWGQNRFLEDEALYATWGLQIVTGADPMLDNEPVDKPPLHAYTLALSFALFSSPLQAGGTEGGLETAARLPSLLASVASIALVYALGRQLSPSPLGGRHRAGTAGAGGEGGEGGALLAALLLALSPFDILFASTAFTDPLMTAWVLGALLAAARGRLGAAGLLAGLAAATKQQGLFFLPLVIAVGVLVGKSSHAARDLSVHAQAERSKPFGLAWLSQRRALVPQYVAWLRFFLSFSFVVAAVLGWDAARVQRPGFWEQGFISYGGLGPAEPQVLGQRAVEWLRLMGYFWGSPWFNGLLAAVLGIWLLGSGKLGDWGIGKLGLTLLIFVVGFLLLHWLVGFQVWDRYLLGLVPLLALLAGRALTALGRAIGTARWRKVYATALPLALIVLLAGPVYRAARSGTPVGGDHGAYDGINGLAAYVRDHVPPDAVLYHHWLGYHYRFYLYGAPLRLHWYPDTDDLVHDATVYRREPRYIAFPSFRDGSAAQAAMAAAGITLAPVMETMRRDGTTSFRLYRLEGP